LFGEKTLTTSFLIKNASYPNKWIQGITKHK
jgi:hypothetical protein